jgi:hypothetical protein
MITYILIDLSRSLPLELMHNSTHYTNTLLIYTNLIFPRPRPMPLAAFKLRDVVMTGCYVPKFRQVYTKASNHRRHRSGNILMMVGKAEAECGWMIEARQPCNCFARLSSAGRKFVLITSNICLHAVLNTVIPELASLVSTKIFVVISRN